MSALRFIGAFFVLALLMALLTGALPAWIARMMG